MIEKNKALRDVKELEGGKVYKAMDKKQGKVGRYENRKGIAEKKRGGREMGGWVVGGWGWGWPKQE
jgi:hypothetical protein